MNSRLPISGDAVPYRLRLPGPTAVPERVLRALARPMIAHRGPEFLERFRDIQARLEAAGIELTDRADDGSADVASATLADPDGNIILLDQHVPRPGA